MIDTLRSVLLAHHKAPTPNKFDLDRLIEAIAAWALEPAQVERAARAGWEREQMIGRPKWEALFAVMREQLTEDTRAAIAALFVPPDEPERVAHDAIGELFEQPK